MLAKISSRVAVATAMLSSHHDSKGGECPDYLLWELTQHVHGSMVCEVLYSSRAVCEAALRSALAASNAPHFAAALLILSRAFAFSAAGAAA